MEKQEYYFTRSDDESLRRALSSSINEYAHYMLDKGLFLSLTFWTSFVAMLWLIFLGMVKSDALHWLIVGILFVCALVNSILSQGDAKIGK